MISRSYTDGVDIISVLHKDKSGYLVRDSSNNTHLLASLKGYRRLDDKKSIKEWYQDSKKYVRRHPIAAFLSMLSVFFGLTQF
jgi:hypothetical protein